MNVLNALLNPWVLLGALVLLLGAVGTGYYEGSSIEKLKGDKRIEALQQQARLVADAEAEKANEAATAFERGRRQREIRYEIIDREINDVVAANPTQYATACFDDAGLRAVNDALTRSQRPPSGPAGGVSGAISTDRLDGSNSGP